MLTLNYKSVTKIIYLAILCLGVSNQACARNDDIAISYDQPDCSLISKKSEIEICKSVDRIEEQVQKYTIERGSIESDSTEGGVIERYKNGAEVVIIKVIYYGEMGKRIIKYYFDSKRNPIFSLDSTINYDRPMYIKGKKIESIKKVHLIYDDSGLLFRISNLTKLKKVEKEKQDYVNKVFRTLVSK